MRLVLLASLLLVLGAAGQDCGEDDEDCGQDFEGSGDNMEGSGEDDIEASGESGWVWVSEEVPEEPFMTQATHRADPNEVSVTSRPHRAETTSISPSPGPDVTIREESGRTAGRPGCRRAGGCGRSTAGAGTLASRLLLMLVMLTLHNHL
jgi:hypothetical protein